MRVAEVQTLQFSSTAFPRSGTSTHAGPASGILPTTSNTCPKTYTPLIEARNPFQNLNFLRSQQSHMIGMKANNSFQKWHYSTLFHFWSFRNRWTTPTGDLCTTHSWIWLYRNELYIGDLEGTGKHLKLGIKLIKATLHLTFFPIKYRSLPSRYYFERLRFLQFCKDWS